MISLQRFDQYVRAYLTRLFVGGVGKSCLTGELSFAPLLSLYALMSNPPHAIF